MGVAEIVPGVSGGTIAFVTGIYDQLIRALASFSPASFVVLKRDGLRVFWERHSLTFLLTLVAGMATSFLALANVIHLLIEQSPLFVWGFFFGLVAASTVYVGLNVRLRTLATVGALGLAAGLGLALLPTQERELSVVIVFLGGALAISAWMLPGISGSFMLLVLGIYQAMIMALKSFDVGTVAVFAAGLACGLLTLSRFLEFLLARYRSIVLAVLTGFMAGSLLRLWPWRSEDGAVLPWDYSADPFVLGVLGTMALGVAVVAGLGYVGRHSR